MDGLTKKLDGEKKAIIEIPTLDYPHQYLRGFFATT